MRLLTVVEAYIQAALEQAIVEKFDDDTLVASVPECEGVIATGSDVHECAQELYRQLEEWVKIGLARGYKLPIIGGIDLNCDAHRTLATYHPDQIKSVRTAHREFFEDENELKAAFAKHRRQS